MKPTYSPTGSVDGILLSIHEKVTDLSPRTEVVQLRWDIQSIVDPISDKDGLFKQYQDWAAENNARLDAGLDEIDLPEEFRGLDTLAKLSKRALDVINDTSRTLGLLAVTRDEIDAISEVESIVEQTVSDGTAPGLVPFRFSGEVTSLMKSQVPQED